MDPRRPAHEAARTQLLDLTELHAAAVPLQPARGATAHVTGGAGSELGDSAAAMLTISRGPNTGHTFALARDSVTVLGRDPACEIVLAHVTVSRRHAEIRAADDGFELVDTGSLNGTYLNKEAVDESLLADGDEIQLGTVRLIFHTRGSRCA